MRSVILSLAAVFVLSAVPLAGTRQSRENAGQAHPHEVSEFAAASREQCDLAMASVADIARLIDEARRVSDVTKSRAALAAAARSVTEVRQHLGSCTDILKLLPRTAGRRTLPFTTSTATVLEVVCSAQMDPAAIPAARHEGQQYYFCSEADRDEFQKDPTRFLAEPHR